MTLDDKIAVLQAAKRGEKIQLKQKGYFHDSSWRSASTWQDMYPDLMENAFNFAVFDYRIAPKNATSITTRKGTKYEVIANEDGSMSFGCETVEKRDVHAILTLWGKGGAN